MTNDDTTTPDTLAALTAVNDAKQWVWATQMGVERFVAAFIRWAGSDKRSPPLPWEAQRSNANTFSEAQFLLNAAGQAMKALNLADIPIGPEGEKVRLLRNLHEHWETQREAFAAKSRPKKLSGAEFVEKFPDTLPWVFKHDMTGTWISALHLDAFWDGLLAAEAGRYQRGLALRETLSFPAVEESPDFARRFPMPKDKGRLLAISVLAQDFVLEFPPGAGQV